MISRGKNAEMQFKYWDLRRKGMTQSEIARKYDISRQSVNRSIKLFEREVMYRMLETSQISGSLVEWFDVSKGVLIGVTPQLENLPFMMILDQTNMLKVFHDPSNSTVFDMSRRNLEDLRNFFRNSLGVELRGDMTFRSILNRVYSGQV